LNVHKDAINILGAQRFALENNQTLIDFFSEDTIVDKDPDTVSSNINIRNTRKIKKIKGKLSKEQQIDLWSQPPSSTNNQIPGKLSLCKGLPVIIKHNTATELCITNGQEGIVYDWTETLGSHKQKMLDTLFVKLTNPAQPVNIPGLPLNVVPIIKSKVNVICQLSNDDYITVSRSQVEVAINYAMTDYASQGKTRHMNVVDLYNCLSHQAYYTALSRSASAAGTLLIQGFDKFKICGKASGALRQEFRNLEILDEITHLRYIGQLPKGMHDADERNVLIKSFRAHNKSDYVPPNMHPAIKWSLSDPFLEPIAEDVPWTVIPKYSH